jgi:hypothetical protein
MDVDDRIYAVLHGPLWFRFVFQPVMSLVLGFRDGRADRIAGRSPFVWGLFNEKLGRKERIVGALRQIALPLALACVMDAIVQILLFRDLRLRSMAIVATLLIALPYATARGLSNRLVGRIRQRRHA